jgi:integrase
MVEADEEGAGGGPASDQVAGLRALGVLRATCAPEAVANYLADHSDYLNPSPAIAPLKPTTLARRVAAIAKVHTTYAANTGADDLEPTHAPVVRQALRGLRNTYADALRANPEAKATRKAPALMADSLTLILDTIDTTTVAGARDAALIALAWSGGLRRSEVVALNLEDLTEVADGLIVHLRTSKTDQAGRGRSVPIFARRLEDGVGPCPVELVRRLIEVGQITTGALFRQVTRGGRLTDRRLCPQAVGRILAARAKGAGLAVDLTAHSLRAGLVTQALRNGATHAQVAAITGHRSVAVLSGYQRDADPHAAALRVAI